MKRLFGLVLLFLLALVSCKENTRVNLISGRVFEDCEQALTNVEIALKSNAEGSFNAPIILGSGITSTDGTLNFTYELEEEDIGTGSLLLIKPTGFEVLLESVVLNQDVELNLYRNEVTTVKVELRSSRIFTNNDTLFYAITNNEEVFLKVAPALGLLDSIVVSNVTPNSDNLQETFYYGLGFADFTKATESSILSDSTFNEIPVILNGCGSESQISITIN